MHNDRLNIDIGNELLFENIFSLNESDVWTLLL